MKKSLNQQIAGYTEIALERDVLRKHARDMEITRGETQRAIDILHPKFLDLEVSEKREETPSTVTLRLVPENGYLPPFQAGQYINIFVEINGVRTSRPYSISSAPNQIGYYDVTVKKMQDGFVSSWLMESLKVGDRLKTTSPAGYFYYNPLFHGKNLVFIAGGSGITPFMSMIREVTDRNLDRKVHLIYGNRNEKDVIFRDELADREARHDQLTVDHVISEPGENYEGLKGFITKELIEKQVPGYREAMFYVCGPGAMYTFVLDELAALGIPKRKIRLEIYGPPAKVTDEPGWPDSVKPGDRFQVTLNGKTITARADETLMNSLERSGILLPAKCRSGECSICRTKLVKGRVFHPEIALIRKSDRKYNYIHPCVAYPLEDLELLY
jgi:ferredoxin-NADP reductase